MIQLERVEIVNVSVLEIRVKMGVNVIGPITWENQFVTVFQHIAEKRVKPEFKIVSAKSWYNYHFR